jgi:hypothetical protein
MWLETTADKFRAAPDNFGTNGGISLVDGTKVSCTSCHGVHFVDSDASTTDGPAASLLDADGKLLKFDGPDNEDPTQSLCQTCHLSNKHGSDGAGNPIGCMVCHGGHEYDPGGAPNYFMLKKQVTLVTPKSGIEETVSLDYTTYPTPANWGGVCQQCHNLPAGHAAESTCGNCHSHSDGFVHGGGAGTGCESCHGHDAGYEYEAGQFSQGKGTVKSHSTHTENDSDDLKGPNIACSDCHNTSSYPNFADGATTLAATTVCDNCHSQAGAYGGAAMAKASWDAGIYETDATTFQPGNEQWCASCHDDAPAYSNGTDPIVIDNPAATFVGSWSTYSSDPEIWWFYGDDFRYKDAGTGSSTATWAPDIPQAGTYSVYAWWTANANRASNAPYTINYDGGSETVEVNQKVNGGQWNYLGTYTFAAGTSGNVVLSDDADGRLHADAIKFERGSGPGTYAPNVTGDNTTYGFYVTGHKVSCTNCHDPSKGHIDGEHRTYEIDESDDNAVVSPYCDSYRLRYIDGEPSMTVPRIASPNLALAQWRDFALCFDCHNRYEVIGEAYNDVSHTNLWDEDDTPNNSHWYHLGMNDTSDSDFDGTVDSGDTCIACHNVHGSPTGPMIRHGELISNPETMNKVPSLNFFYLKEGDGSATATFTPTLAGGTYDVYAWWRAKPNRTENAKYLINHDGGQAEAIVDQEQNGGQWNLLGQFSFAPGTGSVVLTSDGADQYIFADAVRWYRTDDLDEVIVDDPAATYTGTWTEATTNPEQYGSSEKYMYASIADANTSVIDSVGAKLWSGNITSNYTCKTCHSNVIWGRTPDLGPKVFMPWAAPSSVDNSGTEQVLFTAYADDPNGTITSVTIDLSSIDGSVAQTMYDDGTNGDVTASDKTYSFQTTVPDTVTVGLKALTVTATDNDALTAEGKRELMVANPGWLVVDNTPADYVGYWYSAQTDMAYKGYLQAHVAGDGSSTATFTPALSQAGNYNVYAWWTEHSNRSANTPYTINYSGGSDTVPVNQKTNGSQFVFLGTYYFDAQTGHTSVIVDNVDATFVGDWPSSDTVSAYNRSLQYHAAGTGTDTITFTPNLAQTGNYDVYAWWTKHSNRATNAPYTINYSGGSDTVLIDQQQGGGGWIYLGTYSFEAGTGGSVVLSDNANGYLIADAIKFQLSETKQNVVLSDAADGYVIGDAILFEPQP